MRIIFTEMVEHRKTVLCQHALYCHPEIYYGGHYDLDSKFDIAMELVEKRIAVTEESERLRIDGIRPCVPTWDSRINGEFGVRRSGRTLRALADVVLSAMSDTSKVHFYFLPKRSMVHHLSLPLEIICKELEMEVLNINRSTGVVNIRDRETQTRYHNIIASTREYHTMDGLRAEFTEDHYCREHEVLEKAHRWNLTATTGYRWQY